MDPNRYISDFLCSERINIDLFQEILLHHILDGYTSAYKLYSLFKAKKFLGRVPPYKNVHKRIRKLHKGGLIEEIQQPGGYKHGAINYRLTSRGLVYMFSELFTPKDIRAVMAKYPTNSLFKFFVYDYFDRKTLEHSTVTLTSLLQNYIAEGCQKIRLFVDSSLVDSYSVYEGEGYFNPGNFLRDILVYQLEWHKRSFILKVATLKGELIDWENKRANDRQETLELLASDKKFMAALKEYGGEFRKGYDTLILLSNKR
jgi:hypothetical protein